MSASRCLVVLGLSLMVYRRLYFGVSAQPQDPILLTLDPLHYLAEQAKELGIVKRPSHLNKGLGSSSSGFCLT